LVIYDPCDKNSLLAARTLVVHHHVLQLSGDGSEDRVQVDRLDFIVDVDDGDVGLLASQGAVIKKSVIFLNIKYGLSSLTA